MHYRQTIIEAAVIALQGLNLLPGGVTSKRFFPEQAESNPAARVWTFNEIRDLEAAVMSKDEEPRIMTLRIRVVAAGDDVQKLSNDALGQIEGVIPGAIGSVSDKVEFERLETEIATAQDREVMANDLDYTVWYATVLGDPTTRV